MRFILIAALASAHVWAYEWNTYHFQQVLDHFNFANSSTTYSQKYLVNDTWWQCPTCAKKGPAGPIFFYTGNEGPIELFASNTGFMWDIAPEFNALLIFAEHRYYGTSLPFGNQTYSDPKSWRMSFLTAEQALADYAVLLTYLKQKYNAESSPIIAFGGSYGGMLSAWMRMKYPNIIQGSIAASAPILQFEGEVSPYVYNAIITRTWANASKACAANVASSWKLLSSIGQSQQGLAQLNALYSPCNKFKSQADIETTLFAFINNAITYMTMADYPYPSSFLGPMPGWPVDVACEQLSMSNPEPQTLLKGLNFVLQVFYNYTGEAGQCFDMDTNGPSTLGDLGGWNYQSCNEMVMPIGSYGEPNDFFYSQPWDLDAVVKGCQETYGMTPRPTWIPTYYGATKTTKQVTNIVYSNGLLDPWSGGGVLSNDSLPVPASVAVLIPKGAHHLDLRAANEQDPQDVIDARNIHRMHIRQWVQQQ